MSSTDTAARVPAWKRLGLKLKYANDTPQESENIRPQPVDQAPKTAPVEKLNKPQKRPFEDTKPATPIKRPKPAEGPAIHSKPSGGKRSAFDDYQRSRAQAPQRHIGSLGASGTLQAAGVAPKKVVFDDDDDLPPLPPHTAEIATPVQESARPPSPRKSVSFTPDTKGQDGFSAQNFFKNWAAGEDPAEKTATPAAVEEDPKKEKKKKVKKSKSTLIDKDESATKAKAASTESANATEDGEASAQALPYVEYLQQYHQDRGSWKFSKKHQNNLLKNLFNIYRIPTKHNPAIVEYISTIQGSARLRVAEQALKVLKLIWEKHQDALEMYMDTPAARRLAYYQALHRHIERYAASGAGENEYIDRQLEEMRNEVDQGQRSEQILEKLEDELVKAIDDDMANEKKATPVETETFKSEPTPVDPPVPKEVSKAPTPEKIELKKRSRKSKARTQASSEEEESSSDDSSEPESDSSPESKKPKKEHRESTPVVTLPKVKKERQEESLTTNYLEARSRYRAPTPAAKYLKMTGKPFSDDLLDKLFPKPKTYHEVAPKRQRIDKTSRGFQYIHGNRADESGSEDE